MKLNKLSFMLLVSLFAALTAYAQGQLSLSKVYDTGTIHTLEITNNAATIVKGTATLHPGVLHGTTCQRTRTLPVENFSFNAKTVSDLNLNGDTLARGIGLGYSCMDIILQTTKKTERDSFLLYSNSETYYLTRPNLHKVTVS